MSIDPQITNPLYDIFAEAWAANRDFAEMHPHILRNGTYLTEFGAAENPEQYTLRKSWSLAIDLCQYLIDVRMGNLFRSPPKRSFGESEHKKIIEDFLADVDQGGADMDAFMRDVVRQMYISGVDVMVDKTREDGEPQTRADETGVPFVQAFGMLDRRDWDTDHGGGYTFVRFALGTTPRTDEGQEGSQECRFITFTPEGWRLHTVTTTTDNKGVERSTTDTIDGEHNLGQVPVVQFYLAESTRQDFRAIPLSLMTRQTPIAQYMLNLLSQEQLDLYVTVASFVAMGITAEEIPSAITAGGVWAFGNAEAKLQQIVSSVDHVKVKQELIQALMLAQLRIGKMTGVMSELQGHAESGVQVAIESGPLFNELSSTAGQAEDTEMKIIQLVVSRATGSDGLVPMGNLGYHVEYNRKFLIEPTAEIIKMAKDIIGLGVGDEVPALTQLALDKVLDTMTREADPLFDDATKQIADAIFGGVQPGDADGFGGGAIGDTSEGNGDDPDDDEG